MSYFWKILIVCIIAGNGALTQCPDRLSVMNRLAALRESNVSYAVQRKELLGYIVQLQQCKLDDDSVYVHLLQRTGALSYLVGQFNDAAIYTSNAVQQLRMLSPRYMNIPLLVRMYSYLNIFYDSLHLTGNKIASLDSCIYYAINNGLVNNDILNNMIQRVEYSYNTGDYIRCINDAKIAADINERYGQGGDSILFAEFFFNMRINAMIETMDLDKAEQLINERLAFAALHPEMKQSGTLYNQLARISLRRKAFPEALAWLKKSYESNKKTGYALACKESLNNIGFCYFNYLHQPETAHQYFLRALQYNSTTPEQASVNRLENANVLSNIANVHARLQRYDSAFIYFEKAFSAAGEKFDENRLLLIPDDEFNKIPNIHYLISTVRDKADAFMGRYHATNDQQYLNNSISIFRTADKLLTRIKKNQRELLSQLSWRRNAKTIYEHAIQACYESNRYADAFFFFERSRAVLLNDRMMMNRMNSPEILRKIAQLDFRIAQLNLEADTLKGNDARLPDLRKNIFDLVAEKDRVNARVKPTPHTIEDNVTLDYARNEVADDATLSEIFTGDSAVYVLKIDSKVILRKIDKTKYDQLTTTYTAYLTNAEKMNSDYAGFLRVSSELYRLIFENDVIRKRLIVSPDGMYFPFESLVAKQGNNQSTFLIEICPVSYTYSVQFLKGSEQQTSQRLNSFIGFAPVSYSTSLKLNVLAQSDESLEKIGSFFYKPILLIGSHAARRDFLSNYNKFQVVQLYTHASEAAYSSDPVIYFADSALALSELTATDKPATQLIILSACETGKGKWYEGEGVFSFNRTFAELGVPSAMVNLWSVDNQSTYKLNELFCEYLSAGLPSDVALQKAKIDFLRGADREHQLPYYWAAPVIAGRIIALPAQQYEWHTAFTVAAGIAVIAIAFLLIRKKTGDYSFKPFR